MQTSGSHARSIGSAFLGVEAGGLDFVTGFLGWAVSLKLKFNNKYCSRALPYPRGARGCEWLSL